MKIENIYTSVACNRTTDSADWGQNGLIVFAANNAINLMNPEFFGSCKIIKTYVQHEKRVNTVKWIKPYEECELIEFEIISGSDDGNAIIWNIKNLNLPIYYKLEGHKNGVNVVDALYVNDILNIATASTDSTLKLWNYNNSKNKYECYQTIDLKRGLCFAIKMITLPLTNQILLSYAGSDGNIILLTEGIYNDEKLFVKIGELIGHDDWIRSLDYKKISNEYLLATSSQDTFVRIWKLSGRFVDEKNLCDKQLINKDSNSFFHEIQTNKFIFDVTLSENSKKYQIYFYLDSVLQGHEGWVYSVNWSKNNHLQLLSGSIDKSLIIWTQNEEGIWMEKVRVGDVGGNSLGFFGAKFSFDGNLILGHGYQGSFHIWKLNENSQTWDPQTVVSGHFCKVQDICWEKSGKYLLSVSDDQTTRIHAPWIKKNNTIKNSDETITWHEIARPQIHGYNMQCIAELSQYKFASGAQEKIIRTFQASANFIQNFRRLCHIQNDSEGDEILKSVPEAASVPSLGLSNKAVYNNTDTQLMKNRIKDEYTENNFNSVILYSPPQEETLVQNTLWPETQKLYGHGFEIFSLCASHDGKFLASACKATSSEHAQIILWNALDWKQIQKLPSHQLTITQMKFSFNNQYLLSVSRDRTWTLFENKNSPTSSLPKYEVIAKTNAKNGIHSRIIWSCDWSHDNKLFGTSSRDGKAIIWHKTNSKTNTSLNEWNCLNFLDFKNKSVTAISFARNFINKYEDKNLYFIALGLENGSILLYTFSIINNTFNQFINLDKQIAHHSVVKKLQFRPDDKNILLASCGEDNFVKIYKINI